MEEKTLNLKTLNLGINRLRKMKDAGCSRKALEAELTELLAYVAAEIRGELDFYGY